MVLFSFSKLSGRAIFCWSTAALRATGLWLLLAVPVFRQRSGRTSASLPTGGTEKEYHSMAAPAALLDALAVAVAERLGTEGAERLQSLHQLKKAYFSNG